MIGWWKRLNAAKHLRKAERLDVQIAAMEAARRRYPVGHPMRSAIIIGQVALQCQADAERARAGGDVSMATAHEDEGAWYSARHREQVALAGGRVCRGEVVA